MKIIRWFNVLLSSSPLTLCAFCVMDLLNFATVSRHLDVLLDHKKKLFVSKDVWRENIAEC